ncbi:MAG: tetratricopeptide repeat protein [Victivallales bacterium]|nr:tetratricopeptide repeat protein [Victivallales bacterium]
MEQNRYLRALVCYRAGDFSAALTLLDTATPNDPAAQMLTGLCRAGNGDYAAALSALDRATAQAPEDPTVRFNRGTVREQCGRTDDALADYRRVLAAAPEHVGAAHNAARLLTGRGEPGTAATICRKALVLTPHQPQLLAAWAGALSAQGEITAAVTVYRKALAAAPDNLLLRSNLLLNLNYLPIPPAAIFREHRQWQHAFHAAHPDAPPMFPPRDPNERWRIGYLSPDFRYHSVAYFIEPLLRHHRRDRFAIHSFSDVTRPDAITRRLTGLTEYRHDISNMDIAAAVAYIRSQHLDVLVDLAGHTGRKLAVFAHRAAPIQVAYLGYPNTTGLRRMDYRFADDLADRPDTARFYTEKRLFLPGGLWAYAPLAEAPEIQPPPLLTRGVMTFGSCNNQAKISDFTLQVWAGALRACPGSRLRLKNRALRDAAVVRRLTARLADCGIAADRVTCEGFVPGHRAHLEFYHHIDLALDTLPYNGTTTTFEALWMGVPTLTLPGTEHASRVGGAIMGRLGLNSFVAADPDDFARIAAGYAARPDTLAALRTALRPLLADSPLLDGQRLARAVEDQYEHIITRENLS